MFGGEGLCDYVPMSTMLATLPKESERELFLAAEQQQLEEEEVSDHAELVINCIHSPKRLIQTFKRYHVYIAVYIFMKYSEVLSLLLF